MDLFNELGELALGSRLKRLSDIIMKDGSKIYHDNNINFESKYFTVFYLLQRHGPLGIMEIADRLGMSHPSVVQLVKEMEDRKLLVSEKNKIDKRKRTLTVSDKGEALTPDLFDLWDDIATAIHEIISAHDVNLMNTIAGLEHDLKAQSLSQRVAKITSERKMREVEIIDYDPQLAGDFKKINYNWIKKYFKIEAIDREILENHEKYILDRGGYIFFARLDDQIAGTCALIKEDDERYELSKMGVPEKFQGNKIGKKLGLAVIGKAKSLGAKVLFLDSNKKLTPAIRLYERLGFGHVNRDNNQSAYQRSNVYMELKL